MKKILFSAMAIAATALIFSCNGDGDDSSLPLPSDPALGSDMPEPNRKMMDVSGKMVSLNDARLENGLLVMFSCNTCPYVEKNQSRTLEISNYAQRNKIGVIILNSNEDLRDDDDSYSEMKAYANEQGYKWAYVVDENSVMADSLGARRTPETFLFDKDGKLVYRGAIDNNPGNADAVTRKHLQLAIDEMVSGKEISVNTSRSVGCSIKRKG